MIDNILIIEDEKAIQSVLYELLTEAGYRVTLANDGLEGLSQFEKQYFSLILLDIMMPKIDGYTQKFRYSNYHAHSYGRRRSTG